MDANLEVDALGTGEPALLLVHGYACAKEDWAAQLQAFAGTHRCVAVDLPGHGASALNGAPTVAALAAVVNSTRQRACPGPVVLVGHSLGVRVVIDAYLQQPHGVAGLVLVDGRFYDGDPQEVARRMADLVDSVGFDAFIRRAFGGMFTATSDPALRQRVVERAARLDPVYGRALFIESVLWDSTRGRDALRRIHVPVLHLQATDIDEQRRMVSLRPGIRTPFMDLVEELVPGATVQVVPEVGHLAMLEAPDFVNQALAAFLGGLRA